MEIINIQSLKAKLENHENIHLIDVREPDEHAEYNIGGVFLPLGQILAMQTDEISDLQNEEVVCYCKSGKRSLQAALMLESMGFKNVKSLEGGMMAWREAEEK